ncbi:UNVERIFIED_CONTAM: hypothetical protein HDU68_012629, partial [Siphonaria sp. JEL0065]
NIALAIVFMIHRYASITQDYLNWPSAVKVTSKEDILNAYELEVQKPKKENEDTADEIDRKIRLWERNAADWFSLQMEHALKSPVPTNVDGIFKQRISQFKWERPLMAWFMERSSVTPKSVKIFSAEWDALVKQAVETLSRKYQVDKINRGAL